MSKSTYFDIQERIADARGALVVARASHDADEILNVCALLLYLINQLNEKDAPK